MKKLLILACLVPLHAFAQTGPSYDSASAFIGLLSVTGGVPYSPITTTGSAGQAYDSASARIVLGYNSSTGKYYACGTANPCSLGGGSSAPTQAQLNTAAACNPGPGFGGGSITGCPINNSGDSTADQFNLITETGAYTNSANGAASTPAITMTGTPYMGTGTTSTPLFYQNIGGSPTTWGTSGTLWGASVPSGWNGDFINVFGNGTSRFRLDNAGNIYLGGSVNAPTGVGATSFSAYQNGNVTLVANASGGSTTSWTMKNTLGGTGNILDFSNGSVVASVGHNGQLTVPQIYGSGTTPAVSFGAGAGGTPTATSITGHDLSFTINFTTGGTAPTTSAVIATVTFNTAYTTNAPKCVFSPGTVDAGINIASVYKTTTTTTFVLNSTTTALPNTKAFSYDVSCTGA